MLDTHVPSHNATCARKNSEFAHRSGFKCAQAFKLN
jgi:hypothetical protein